MADDDIWTTDAQGNPVQIPNTGTKKMTTEDITYVEKMNNAIKGKQEQSKEQPQKEPLRKRMQERFTKYVEGQQQKEYNKKVAKEYFLNFYVQDKTGNWQLFRTVNKQDKKQVRDTRNELIVMKAIFQELEGSPNENQLNSYLGKLKKTWTSNLSTNIAEARKQAPGLTQSFGEVIMPDQSQMPSMAISAFGSMFPPTDIKQQYPSFQNYKQQAPAKPKKRQYIQHEQYEGLLQAGYQEADLEANGIVSKRSKFYQDQSPFGKWVSPYRPISYGQAFFHMPDAPKTEFQKRTEEGRSWEGFKPPMAGQSFFRPIISTPRDPTTGKMILFSPKFADPMHTEVDQFGNPKKKFFTPMKARL